MTGDDEYAILLLKPDGAADPAVRRELDCLLLQHRLSVESMTRCSLLPAGVLAATHRTEEDYARYLLSGPVEVLLLHGPDALEQTLQIKRKIRKRFDKLGRVENLIHAADPGNEMSVMLQAFFPNLAAAHRVGAADQYWVPDDLDHLNRGLIQACEQHPTGTVIPVLRRNVIDLWRTAEILSRHNVKWVAIVNEGPASGVSWPAEVLRYFRVSGTGRLEGDGLPALGYVREESPDFSALMQAAKTDGFELALCYHPTYSLQKVDRLEDAASAVGLLALAGSGDSQAPFVVANGAHYMRLLEARSNQRVSTPARGLNI
jgi:hypothetical protein